MNNNFKYIKNFKAVNFMRDVRDKISIDIESLNFSNIKNILKNAN